MSSEPAISAHHVSKVYDLGLSGRTRSIATIAKERLRHPLRGTGQKRERLHALDDVSFDIAAGEAVGVIGKNGAGKSTLLKILSRITPPTSGYIEMASSVGSLLEVGTGFHPELTGIENVYLNGTILGMSKREVDRRLDEIVDFAEVDKFLDTPVKRYSSGMRVRLAFAVAAHLDPDILIIDEVLSVGDFAFQAKCLDKMRAVAAHEGRTVLYVSHNLVTVEHLCPRSLLLADGRLVFDGSTNETISKYLHTFPRAERGSTPGVFDLAAGDRSNGEYGGTLFKRLDIVPNRHLPSDTLRMGEPLRVEIVTEGLDATPNANVTLTIESSSSSQVLCRLSCRMRPLKAAHERRADETIVIDIPSLPLTPGEYYVNIAAFADGATILDEVHRAGEFTVIPVDVLGNGYQFSSPKDGVFYLPWEWEVRPTCARDDARPEAPSEVGGV